MMKGNTITEFIDDLLIAGGPEKEFVFQNKFYFLETLFNKAEGKMELRIDEYDRLDISNPAMDRYVRTYSFLGKDFEECTSKFEKAKIFHGQTIYEAEAEIEVLFG